MQELLRRLSRYPSLSVQLLIASIFANFLALAGPIFVMQVLNRYVAHGVDSTLMTLVLGVLIAISLEFAFRVIRNKIARAISSSPDEQEALKSFAIITKAKTSALEELPQETRREIISSVGSIEQAYSASNLTAVIDVPFAFLFVLVLWMLEPIIALIVLAFILFLFVSGVLGSRSMQKNTQQVQQLGGEGSGLLSTATREGDTIRSFNAGEFIRTAWREHTVKIQNLRRDLNDRQGLVQTVGQTTNGLLSVAVIGIGAGLVVAGEMDVGAMIGGNILAARALQPISKFSQMGSAFAKAREALKTLQTLKGLPLEREKGSALTNYNGRVEFRDLAFAYKGNTSPIFESLDLKVEPGEVLIVAGANGAGKTTFARLLSGLIEPSRGQILIDGLDIQQVAPEWWRKQIVYLPQEPGLLNATLKENILVNNLDLDNGRLNEIIDEVGLRRFVDESPDGLETMVHDNGWRMSEGIRRRVAFARALVTDGNVIIIDEPTESFDSDGIAAVHKILGTFARNGKTIVVMTHDPKVVKGRHILLNLNSKPVPMISVEGEEVETRENGSSSSDAAQSGEGHNIDVMPANPGQQD